MVEKIRNDPIFRNKIEYIFFSCVELDRREGQAGTSVQKPWKDVQGGGNGDPFAAPEGFNGSQPGGRCIKGTLHAGATGKTHRKLQTEVLVRLGPIFDPNPPDSGSASRIGQHSCQAMEETLLAIGWPAAIAIPRLLEVVLLLDDVPLALSADLAGRHGILARIGDVVEMRREIVDLLLPLNGIHHAIMVVVMMRCLWCIGRQGEIVGPQPVSLSVCVAEDPGLEELVLTVVNPRNNDRRTEC